jgi:hypothetical protein
MLMHALPPWSSVGLEYRNGLETNVEKENKDQSKYMLDRREQSSFFLGGGVRNKKSTWFLHGS